MSAIDDSGFGVVGASALSDVNLIRMFSEAGLMVKCVVLCLIVASVISWTVIFNKLMLFSTHKRKISSFEDQFNASRDVELLHNKTRRMRNNAYAAVFNAALDKFKQSRDGARVDEVHKNLIMQDIKNSMDYAANNVVQAMEDNLTVLATIASVSPFVGLFGTVWGIMTSFQSIANSKNTSLAVVAPGIAEALMVTAIGLLTAIPAVIFYNKFLSEVNFISGKMGNFMDRVNLIIVRRMNSTGSSSSSSSSSTPISSPIPQDAQL